MITHRPETHQSEGKEAATALALGVPTWVELFFLTHESGAVPTVRIMKRNGQLSLSCNEKKKASPGRLKHDRAEIGLQQNSSAEYSSRHACTQSQGQSSPRAPNVNCRLCSVSSRLCSVSSRGRPPVQPCSRKGTSTTERYSVDHPLSAATCPVRARLQSPRKMRAESSTESSSSPSYL